MMHVMTIDVEDWYHSLDEDPSRWERYEDRVAPAVRRLLDRFEEAGATATFFVLGHVARKHPDLVQELADRGHEVGSHGMNHRFVYRQTPDEFERDVATSIETLHSITGRPVRSYRAPYFSVTSESMWALPVLERLGIEYDSSIFPVHNHRYGIPGAVREPHRLGGLMELPPSTCRVAGVNVPVAGGVYFRAFAYPVLRPMLQRVERSGAPIVFYLHPWEIDDGQPRVQAPVGKRTRHYWALARTEAKLARLLRDFRFQSIDEAFGP